MKEYEIVERKPTALECLALREAVAWGTGDVEAFEGGLEKTLYGVCAVANGNVTGMARIVGDDHTVFYIQDVIVHPDYQRMGIGSALMERVMNYIERKACKGAVVGLMSAKGKEAFYEKYGFWKRPNEHFGYGMMQFWRQDNE